MKQQASIRVEVESSLWAKARGKGLSENKKAAQVIEEALKLWLTDK